MMLLLVTALWLVAPGSTDEASSDSSSDVAPSSTQIAAPRKNKTAPAPAAPVLTCKLLTTEAPRGGRLEVEGSGFGHAPLVRIAGKVARMLERTETKISVQVHADSNGGAVTVFANKHEATCGTLTIIGKD